MGRQMRVKLAAAVGTAKETTKPQWVVGLFLGDAVEVLVAAQIDLAVDQGG